MNNAKAKFIIMLSFVSLVFGSYFAFYSYQNRQTTQSQAIGYDSNEANMEGGESSEPRPPEPPCCFLKNTLVTLPDKTYKYIQDIKAGDMVLNFDPKSQTLSKSKVKVAMVKTMPGYYIFSFADGSVLKVTAEHPILSTNPSYPDLVYNYFIRAKNLKVGDSIYRLKSGSFVKVKIVSKQYIATPVTVYNMNVDGNETLFANDIAVHNKPCDVDTDWEYGSTSSTSTSSTSTSSGNNDFSDRDTDANPTPLPTARPTTRPTATPTRIPTSTPIPSTTLIPTQAGCPLKSKGDANCDGVVNQTDYFYYVLAVNGGTLPAGVNCDFNGDGEVGAKDRAIIINTLNNQ